MLVINKEIKVVKENIIKRTVKNIIGAFKSIEKNMSTDENFKGKIISNTINHISL